jgi:lysozyme
MKTSDAGIFALALHEGIVPAPYKDSVGVWTFGIGHTAAAGAPDPATMPKGMPADLDRALARVFEVFRQDLPKYEAGVMRALKVPVTQAQFDALVSFHYNTGAIGRATLVKKLNAGDVAGAAAGFMAWTKPKEITERRRQEQALFAKGVYPSGQVTVWGATPAGNVVWKPVKRLNMAQVLAMLHGKTEPKPEPARPIPDHKPITPGMTQNPNQPKHWLTHVLAFFAAISDLFKR